MDKKTYDFSKMTAEAERQVFATLNASGDSALRAQIIKDNMGLVMFFAGEFIKKNAGRGLDIEDLVQEGCIGLMLAVERFDVNNGARFSTYAGYYIKRYMIDFIVAETNATEGEISFDAPLPGTEELTVEDTIASTTAPTDSFIDKQAAPEGDRFTDVEEDSAMRRTAKCIRMLSILNTGGLYKASELARLLGTKTRNIIDYKAELENAGYIIESVPGRYGGYRLSKSNIFPAMQLSEKEKTSLSKGLEYLRKRNDFMYKDDYVAAMGAVMSSISRVGAAEQLSVINRFPLVMPEEELKRRYDFMQQNIDRRETVKFVYLSLTNKKREYVFSPYELFMYNNAWYVIGWVDLFDRAMYFKLNRITDFERTGKKFIIRRAYKRGDYLDETGFKNNGEWYRVEFEAYNQYAMLVQERVYGKNQVVTVVDDHTTKVAVDMQNRENILVFMLGFGANVKVLEPQWLREEIQSVVSKVSELYGGTKN